jgi:hypothetical protein
VFFDSRQRTFNIAANHRCSALLQELALGLQTQVIYGQRRNRRGSGLGRRGRGFGGGNFDGSPGQRFPMNDRRRGDCLWNPARCDLWILMGRRRCLDGRDDNARRGDGRHGWRWGHHRRGRSQGKHGGSAREKACEADEGAAAARRGGEALKASPRRERGGAQSRWTDDAGRQTLAKTSADVRRRLHGCRTARKELGDIRWKGI